MFSYIQRWLPLTTAIGISCSQATNFSILFYKIINITSIELAVTDNKPNSFSATIMINNDLE